ASFGFNPLRRGWSSVIAIHDAPTGCDQPFVVFFSHQLSTTLVAMFLTGVTRALKGKRQGESQVRPLMATCVLYKKASALTGAVALHLKQTCIRLPQNDR